MRRLGVNQFRRRKRCQGRIGMKRSSISASPGVTIHSMAPHLLTASVQMEMSTAELHKKTPKKEPRYREPGVSAHNLLMPSYSSMALG